MFHGRLSPDSPFGDVWLHAVLVIALIVLSELAYSHRLLPETPAAAPSMAARGPDATTAEGPPAPR